MNPQTRLRLPTSGEVTLLLFVGICVVMPMVFAWKGFAYMVGTIIFGVGLRPHIKRLSEEGFSIPVGCRWRGQYYSHNFCIRIKSESFVLKIMNWVTVVLVLGLVPLIGYLLQGQGMKFALRLQAQEPAIREGAALLLSWAQATAPGIVPSGEVGEVFGGLLNQIFGDLNRVLVMVARQGMYITSVVIADWIYVSISLLIVCVFVGDWDKEVASFRKIITRGIVDEALRRRVLRYLELYQEAISTLMIGFVEVALTLAIIYMVLLALFPFNLSLGAILFIALVLGVVTAVWKVGGMLSMALGALFIFFNFEAGLSWFGFGMFSFGLFTDVLIKVVAILVIAKFVGLLEAYNFTPKIIGEKLHLTKLQMVSTIIVWALGSGFFGMIWGVLLMLAVQASMRSADEAEAEAKEAAKAEAV